MIFIIGSLTYLVYYKWEPYATDDVEYSLVTEPHRIAGLAYAKFKASEQEPIRKGGGTAVWFLTTFGRWNTKVAKIENGNSFGFYLTQTELVTWKICLNLKVSNLGSIFYLKQELDYTDITTLATLSFESGPLEQTITVFIKPTTVCGISCIWAPSVNSKVLAGEIAFQQIL